MRSSDPRHLLKVITAGLVAGLAAAALSGCAGDSGAPSPSAPAGSAAVGQSATGSPAATAIGWSGDACTLLTVPDLATVFPAGAPAAEPKPYGAGFSECRWEQGDVKLRVAIVPVANLGTDYVDKLNVSGPVAELGEGAVWFPGVLSIGSTSAGGATVGFRAGQHGVLVAVRSAKGSQPQADLALATALAKVVPARLS
jgi:hypothetical protein